MSKTWFVTGASSGLGRIMTERLLTRGDRVAATARRTHMLEGLQEQYPESLLVEYLDVTDTGAVRAVVQRVFSKLGKVDVVVSNAGYGLFGAGEELTDAQIDHQIATNLTGSIQLIRSVLPHLRDQGGGRIVQVSSEGGQIAYPNFSLYHSTKWGIEGFVESVAQEVKPFGIDFLLVEPGPTQTGFADGLVRPEPMQVYEDSPAGELRRGLDDGSLVLKGDAEKTVTAMIDAADASHPPVRLVLGSIAYESITQALTRRLEEVKSQWDIALSADTD